VTQPGSEDLPTNVGLGPATRIPTAARQAVLDAAAAFQMRRSEAAAAAAQGRLSQGEIVAVGTGAVNDWLWRSAASWGEVLSVRPTATATQVRAGLCRLRR
jgi:hypothetical protein